MEQLLVFSLLISISLFYANCTTVTFSHGGQLLGKQFQYDGLAVDLFLEVPYAKPPVGNLRFKKPQEAEGWSGVRDLSTSEAKMCPQFSQDFTTGFAYIGDEDCLYLDIVVPGGVEAAANKAVMVFIHGGGYFVGSKNGYMGAILAARGDVIVVTINYRLGVLGFLSEGEGTGNYGLWDQRLALMWVRENIALFGGDADRITIFGESAGAASVSAQTLGRYNEGLFQRAIQQSGNLYNEWGWNLSAKQIKALAEGAKQRHTCDMGQSVYKCLANKTPLEIMYTFNLLDANAPKPMVPTPDNDFFPEDISGQSYVLSQRFDQIIGFNADEGNLIAIQFKVPALPPTDQSLNDGMTLDYLEKLLKGVICAQTTPLSVGLCADYIISLYELDSAIDDKERARRFTQYIGHSNFDADLLAQLKVHGDASQKSTYAYYFTEQFKLDPPVLNWIVNNSADHGDDLPFVFGGVYLKGSNIVTEYYGVRQIYPGDVAPSLRTYDATQESDKLLTEFIITAWTNFAKSGDPNSPVSLPMGAPAWPEYDSVNDRFMELNENLQIITTPNKDKLEGINEILMSARREQIVADSTQEMYENCVDDDGDNNGGNQVRDDPDNGSPSKTHFASVNLLVAFSYLMCM